MRSFLAAVRFLTRIPVPPAGAEPRALGRSAFWFPLVGLLLGALLLGSYLAFLRVFPLPLARILTLVVQVLVSGAFHLDGLADTADGLYGGKDREDTLRIMKDPRIGAMGAIALLTALLMKAAAFLSLGEAAFRGALLAMPVLGHAAMTVSLALPYARAEGLGKVFADHRSRADAPAAVLVALGVAFYALRAAGLGAALAAALAAGVLMRLARDRIGGVTGDVSGAANETAELGFLLGLSALAPR